MPEIEIRPAVPSDIPILIALDHSTITDVVWQMEFRHQREPGQIDIHFQRVRLPRPVRQDYPKPVHSLAEDWTRLSSLLVASHADQVIGYIGLVLDRITQAVWVTDLAVKKSLRRKGIGSALVLAAVEWSANQESRDLVLEMHPKNGPGIDFAFKMGFEFCGYNDFYYPVNKIGVFFRKSF